MKTRVIAAMVLLPLLLVVVLAAPKIFTAILFGLMAFNSAHPEQLRLVYDGYSKLVCLCKL